MFHVNLHLFIRCSMHNNTMMVIGFKDFKDLKFINPYLILITDWHIRSPSGIRLKIIQTGHATLVTEVQISWACLWFIWCPLHWIFFKSLTLILDACVYTARSEWVQKLRSKMNVFCFAGLGAIFRQVTCLRRTFGAAVRMVYTYHFVRR